MSRHTDLENLIRAIEDCRKALYKEAKYVHSIVETLHVLHTDLVRQYRELTSQKVRAKDELDALDIEHRYTIIESVDGTFLVWDLPEEQFVGPTFDTIDEASCYMDSLEENQT